MHRRAKRFYPPGLHLALRIDSGYRPAMVLQDGGGDLVKVRYTANGLIQEQWVERRQLSCTGHYKLGLDLIRRMAS